MRKNQSGQTLIEAIVALVTILIIITAISIVVVSGISNSQFIKNQNEANKYAQQGMELVRDVQQNNLSAFRDFVGQGTTCIREETSELYYDEDCFNGDVITADHYKRTITFAQDDARCNVPGSLTPSLRVTVTVKWSSTKCSSDNTFCHSSELVSCMPYDTPATQP